MPVRPIISRPNGPVMRVYDRFTLGDLIEISVIDGRQYRSRQACYAPPNRGGAHLETNASCPERLDPGRTMLGFGQEAWLYAGLARSKARWNLIAQDVLMAQLRRKRDGIDAFWTDDWNGYPANRARLLQHIHDSKVANPVVISGDIHSFFANDLKLDDDDHASTIVATEFVGSSISAYKTAIRSDCEGATGQSACTFFRQPPPRLCRGRSGRGGDADADARRLRRARPQGDDRHVADIRRRERPGWRGPSLVFEVCSLGRRYLSRQPLRMSASDVGDMVGH
jgi:phosphodiesterase/alkaline phosphatase D-like protein